MKLNKRTVGPVLRMDKTNMNVLVGPFKVHISNKQHYRLYTAEVEGVPFLKQASFPSVTQLCDALREVVSSGRLPRSVTTPILKAAAPFCQAEANATNNQHKKGR